MKKEKVKIYVQVQANARYNDILGEKDGIWQMRIAAQPIKGRANQELVSYLGSILQISKSALIIEKGLTSRRKLITINGLPLEKIRTRFQNSTRQQHKG
jgi:uncharacterized protein (TIGR00251 family)